MLHRPLLLVAEDDPDDQVLIQDMLAIACPQEFEALFVWDGVELIDYLRKQEESQTRMPALVLLDLNMPRKDGRAALREMKSDPALADIPVVVLTTSNSPTDIEYCEQYGVARYCRKPSSITELREILGGLCTDYLN
ncbi:MAG: response regulator [Chloroflexota bacterium]|nr:MAG: response regulator [Chloroflexota bacterium]